MTAANTSCCHNQWTSPIIKYFLGGRGRKRTVLYELEQMRSLTCKTEKPRLYSRI